MLPTSDGLIALADHYNNRVAWFNASTLSYTGQWTAQSTLQLPLAIAQAPGAKGNIYVSEVPPTTGTIGGTIVEFASDGTSYTRHDYATLPGHNNDVVTSGLAVASNGNVFAPQFWRGSVYMWDATISTSTKLQAPSDVSGEWKVWGAAADRRKRRVLLPDINGGRVHAYTDTGAFLQTLITGLTTPTNVAVGPTGDIYVVEVLSGKLKKFDGNGMFLGLYAGQVPTFTHDVAVGPDGAVYLPEYYDFRVHKITCM
jgi:hypothetical protein